MWFTKNFIHICVFCTLFCNKANPNNSTNTINLHDIQQFYYSRQVTTTPKFSFFFWQFVCRSIPSSSHSSRALEALSLNRGSSHDVVFVLWLPGNQIRQEGQFSREAIKTQIKEQLTWMRESSALSSKFTEDGRPPLQGGATITSDTGDATVKSALLPSIVRQHSRWLVVGTSVQRWGRSGAVTSFGGKDRLALRR